MSLGGEQSGHVILSDIASTGDGILTAIILANIVVEENIEFSSLFDVKLYPQTNINVVVKDKLRIVNSEDIAKLVSKYNFELKDKGRVMVRASGTEPKIRIMVESEEQEINIKIANDIASLVNKIDAES